MVPRAAAAAAPASVASAKSAASTDIDLTLDSLFEFGLARLLDGYAVFLGETAEGFTRRREV
jgi:hypothetical protein